jgi:hippurate hydrolase
MQQNIISERADFDATVRTFSAASQAAIRDRAVRLCAGIAEAHGLRAEIEWETLYPVTINDPSEADFLAATAADLLGAPATMLMPHAHTGSEDFARVLERVPGAFAFLGATPAGVDPGTAPFNHSAQAVFDESALVAGSALYAQLALDRLAVDRLASSR